MPDNGRFTIGALARRTGLTTRTIRFYSDEGLLPPAERSAGGYRLYDARSLAAIELVKTLRELGLGLPEIDRALAGQTTIVDLARHHIDVLDNQIRLLNLRRAVLRAVTNRGSDEVTLMTKLAGMTDEERDRLIDEFWDEVTGGLNIDPAFADRMRSAKPQLPADPTPEQLEAWIELAELVRDKDFRARIRQMSESHSAARTAGQSMAPADDWPRWTEIAAEALAADEPPTSARARALSTEITTTLGISTAQAADHIATGTDTRAERYWQLMATINGWPPIPTRVPAVEWLIAALRAAG
ncbi:MAG TPA: MerR family transcriptional regulator [Actinophytocola sp.]|uniref:MerR family transcriptional regulator n=1 Tax=Actinophytocola sp. TaxID=1872138 RepID=UPI002DBA8F36|nr:MerR family transcriptional regulator [Actinophytocola sp.]HEU5475510.1 MerR family transcriptional regulator [Actinophytocola sp.]